jgi:5-formyltetrahydrofolate cyclo-ligase
MRSSSFSDDANNAVTSDNDDNEEKKRSLRAKIKSRLKTHASREEELRDSEVICEKIMGMRAYREAKTMCVYIAHPKLHEVDCSTLIREALSSSSSSSEREKEEEEKKVYVPIVDDKNSNVRFLRIRDLEKDLEKRTMGIMEPTETDWRTNERREDLADLKDDERLDLVITPGLAFDETCKRLGRGGGYYDKFLREGKGREAVKIGLAYDAQIVDGEAEDEAIPLDPWDVVLDVVVSKSREFYREKVDGE